MCKTVANLEFTLDAQTGKVSWCPPLEPAPLTHQLVLNALRNAGFANYFIHDGNIDTALTEYAAAAKAPPAPLSPTLVAESRPATAEVKIDDACLTATLLVTGPYGGSPVSLKLCATVLKAAHIAHGLDMAALNELVKQSQSLAPGQTLTAIVARGAPAIDGDDSRFESIAPTVKDRILAPLEREDGSIDYHELGAIPMVRTGDPLIRRIPPTAGKNGVTVFGEPCFAKAGKNLPFTLLSGAQISPSDNNLLIAATDGMPVLIDCGMSVEKVYQVRNVNATTGNVTFEGGVVVEGDVSSGFSVSADSDINIAGLVDSARIVAGNDVVANTGITGSMTVKTLAPSAFVTAGNVIWASFAQFAELHANVGVIAMKLLLHCKITSLDWIKLGGDKPSKSKLIGGEARAINLIKVDTLGDPSEIKTIVHLLGDFDGYKNEHKILNQRIQEKNHQLNDIDDLTAKLRQKQLGAQQKEEMSKRLEATASNVRDELHETEEAMRLLEERHQQSCTNIRLIITRKAYPGVEITIGDRRVVLKEEWGPGTVQYGSDGLLFNRGVINIPSLRKNKS